MHFVKKVPTTEEEKAAHQRLQTPKLRQYCSLRDGILRKIKQGEMDAEALRLTAEFLCDHPDVYTFWNFRRTILCKLIEKRNDEEDDDESVVKRNDQLLSNELSLTENCLLSNPKSYGAWFHRGWALSRITNRDIKRELKLTAKALQIDSRNFHCWDYRRFVVKLEAGVSGDMEELKFTDQLINANFSNYSAWHYRSNLLPRISQSRQSSPHSKGATTVLDEHIIDAELKKLANAYFTDPEDQSAWIYTEWFIAMDPHKANKNDDAKLLTMTFDEALRGVILVFDKAVSAEEIKQLITFTSVDHSALTYTPISLYGSARYAQIFLVSFKLSPPPPSSMQQFSQALLRSRAGLTIAEIEPCQGFADMNAIYNAFDITQQFDISTTRKNTLNEVVENCNVLIEEMTREKNENLIKWPLFTLTRCLIELDSIRYHQQIIANLKRLADELDTKRSAMYRDLIDQYQLNAHLRSNNNIKNANGDAGMIIDSIIESSQNGAKLCLKDLSLHSLNHLQLLAAFIVEIDVSTNVFSDLRSFSLFPRLTHLTLNENPIGSLDQIWSHIPRLEYLSVAGTMLSTFVDVEPVLKCQSLKRFIFCETPLASNDEQCKILYDTVKQSHCTVRLIRHWL